MNKLTRVLQIIGKHNYGGVEKIVFDYYKMIDRNRYQFDFVIVGKSNTIYEEKILKLGGKVYTISSYINIFKQIKQIRKIIRDNMYKIVVSNINTLSFIPLYAAYKENVNFRILFNHAQSNKKEIIRDILKIITKPISIKYGTHFLSCSKESGKWMYGNKKHIVLDNKVDTSMYYYNIEIKRTIRKKYNINDNAILLGNIGRICITKNQIFLIDVLKELHKSNNNYFLIIVGVGNKDKLIKRINKYKLNQYVLLLDSIENINEIYNALDIFLLPSLWEGKSLSLLEAQLTGLPCIVSDYVDYSSAIIESTKFLKLDKYIWTKEIISTKISRHLLDNKEDFDIKRNMETLYSILDEVTYE